jgi:hypothetical protein
MRLSVMLWGTLLLALAVALQGPRERLPGWNATFAIPSGWRILQVSGRAAALSDSGESSALFVAAALITTRADALFELEAMFADLRYTATATSPPRDTTFGARRALVTSYSGTGRAGIVETRAAVVFTAHGTAVIVVGLAGPERFAAISATVAGVAASIDAGKPLTHVEWVRSLSGRWDYTERARSSGDSAGTITLEEWLEFDGRERFRSHSRAVVSLSGASPIEAHSVADTGTYTVIGSTLVLRGATRTRSLDVRLAANELQVGPKVFRRRRP